MMKKYLHVKKGFTLIELLVVVLIIGILSSIALPQYTVAVEKARSAEALTMIGSIKKAVDVYWLGDSTCESIEAVGKNGYSTGYLDIDVESVLQCTQDDDLCQGKYFSFDAYGDCYDFTISVGRRSNPDDSAQYYLRSYRYEGGQWDNYCDSNGTDLGEKICKNLESQGWSPE